MTLNQRVVGSSPTGETKEKVLHVIVRLFLMP